MTEAFSQLLAANRFPGVPEWVRPAYEGQSIVNLMHSLLAHFGVHNGTPLAFHDQFAQRLAGKRKVVLLLLDGFGWLNLDQAGERQAVINDVVASASRWPLTSIAPSTTSAATASFLTALPPAQHGVLGFTMFFPAYHRVFNMLNFRSVDHPQADLISYGFHPEQYIPHPSVLTQLAAAGVMTSAFTFVGYAGSGLSRLLYPRGLPHPYFAFGDMLALSLDQLHAPGPQFHFLYWSSLDTIAHTYGAGSAAYAGELAMLLTTIRDQLLPQLDEETAFLICADHGHIDGDDNEAVNLGTIPGLSLLFRVPPAGEGRMTQLFIMPGEEARAQEMLRETGHLHIMTKAEFLASGLLGATTLRPDLHDRLGDLVVLPTGSRRTLYPYEPRPHTAMVGRHGGLTREEMVVPLLAWA